jgi:hypothetical protein
MQLRRRVELAFEKKLGRIASGGEEITAWEAECLRAALMLLAMRDYAGACEAIKACKRSLADRAAASTAWTLDDFRNCLALLKDPPSDFRKGAEEARPTQ